MIRREQLLALFVVLVLVAPFLARPANAAPPVGFLVHISDIDVAGCGYDPDSPGVPIQVHVYAEAGFPGMIGIADRSCPWSSDPQWAGRGFWIQYRRLVSSTNQVGVALIGTASDVTWLPTTGVPRVNAYQRSSQTLLVGTPSYQVGISKRFGAAVVEYYNRRIDGTLNLIHSHVGAAFQTALFGGIGDEIPRDGRSYTCVGGTQEFWWNPTQAGALCPQYGGMFTPTPVWACETSIPGGCSATTLESTYGWVRFYLRWRNFVYPYDPTDVYPYRVYDDVYGSVTYTFAEDYLEAEWRLWRDGAAAGGNNPPPSRGGPNYQQLPILFGVQATELTYKRDGEISIVTRTSPSFASSTNFQIDADDGRWVSIRSVQYDPAADPVMAPNAHLTLASYMKAHAGVCRPRYFQFDLAAGTNSANPPQYAVVQSSVYFQPQFPFYTEARALLFPYLHSEVLPGRTTSLGALIDTPQSAGGFMPSWECNR